MSLQPLSFFFSWPVFAGKVQSTALKTNISYASLLSILRQGIPIMHLIVRLYGNYKENKTVTYCYCIKKTVSYTVNSRALTGEKPCINKGFLVLLMRRKLTFNMIVPGPLKLFRHTLLNCHNTINW